MYFSLDPLGMALSITTLNVNYLHITAYDGDIARTTSLDCKMRIVFHSQMEHDSN